MLEGGFLITWFLFLRDSERNVGNSQLCPGQVEDSGPEMLWELGPGWVILCGICWKVQGLPPGPNMRFFSGGHRCVTREQVPLPFWATDSQQERQVLSWLCSPPST